MNDFVIAIKYASNLYQRAMLAMAATLYSFFTLIGPDKAHYILVENVPHSMLLPLPYKIIVSLTFGLDAALLWWRLLDKVPRLWWGRGINYATAVLWLTVTIAGIFVYGELLADMVGEIMLTMTALYTLTRTDFTTRDRGTA